MRCPRSMQRLLPWRHELPLYGIGNRTFASFAARRAAGTTAQSTTTTNALPPGKPAVVSTSATQPLTNPSSPALGPTDVASGTNSASRLPSTPSSTTSGTVLKGLNFIKSKQDPVALDDSEYPAWLWGVLNESKEASGKQGAEEDGDLFSKSKKQRRRAAKALRKQQLLNPESLAPKVPLHEQTIDLPHGDGSLQAAKEAEIARQDLTKAMRDDRRRKIKEDNFLREMR